jgi:hypothetical protein
MCTKNSKTTVWRHNDIRDNYINMIKSIDPVADIESEQIVRHRMTPNGPVGVRCDTLYNIGPDSYIIDFVVTNPSCKTYNTARYKAYENVNATVLHAQKYKHVHYANCVPHIDPRCIIASLTPQGALTLMLKPSFLRPVVLRPSAVLNFKKKCP